MFMNKKTFFLWIGIGLLVAAVFFLTKAFPEPMTGSVVLTSEGRAGNLELSKDSVMKVLNNIKDPERDAPLAEIVGLKPEDVEIQGSAVTVTINLPSYCPLKDNISSSIKKELGKIRGVESVEVKLKDELVEE